MKTVRSRGFTIIELLVVVSIVGLISSVILANLNSARQDAIQATALQFDASVRMAIGDRIVGSWNFNEGAGNTAFDDSGNNLNGTVSAGAAYATPGLGGTGAAIYFNGTNSYVNGTGMPKPDPATGFTISAFVRPDGPLANNKTIMMVGNGACKSAGVGVTSSVFSVSNNVTTVTFNSGFNQTSAAALAVGQGGELAQAQPLQDNTWTSVVTSFNPDHTVTAYVNGRLAGTIQGLPTTNCFGTTSKWSIGAIAIGGGVSQGFVGAVDQVAVYQGVTTAAGAQKIYAEGLRKLQLAEKN